MATLRLALASALLSSAALPLPAAAAPSRERVAVLAIPGSDGAIEEAIERALRPAFDVVPRADWEAAAKKLFASGTSSDEVAAVGTEVGAAWVVTAAAKQDEAGWVLNVSLRSGRTGKKVERFFYPLPGPLPSLPGGQPVDAATQKRIALEVPRAVRRAGSADGGEGGRADGADAEGEAKEGTARDRSASPPARGAPPARGRVAPTQTPGPSRGDDEDDLADAEARARRSPPPRGGGAEARRDDAAVRATVTRSGGAAVGGGGASKEAGERPPWTPYVDGSAGLIVSGRNFTFEPAGQPFFATTVGQGLHVDVTGYPLAALAKRPGRTINAITGLGLGLTVDAMFWPDAVPCARDEQGACAPTTERYGVSEYRAEGGLRWHWNPLMIPDSIELLASLQYGQHGFAMDKRADGTNVGAPDVSYKYVTLGVGAFVPLARWIALVARFNFHALVDQGAVNALTEYGDGGAYGLRAGGGVDLTLWRGLYVRLAGFYERFGLSFEKDPTAEKSAASGVDHYYGAITSVGWAEHRGTQMKVKVARTDTDGDGVADEEDACPGDQGPVALGGCPDADGDGVADREDRCPGVAGPIALTGCPDGDGDGIADAEDRCPGIPGDPANEGCRAFRTIKLTSERIELSGKIFFAYDRVDILPKSHEMLDEVAQALLDQPELRVRILGHTDASGNEKHNLELSEGRAVAVMQYLVGRGIDGSRLEAKGYGSQYPIDSNKTQSGRENNRRVEFVLVQPAPSGAERPGPGAEPPPAGE